jgi:hypothetical protein
MSVLKDIRNLKLLSMKSTTISKYAPNISFAWILKFTSRWNELLIWWHK